MFLYAPKRRVVFILNSKELEHFPSFGQIVIVCPAIVNHRSFGCGFRFICVLFHQMNETGKEVVIEALIAMEDKTQQVEIDGPGVELLEPIDRVVRDQRGGIRDGFPRNIQCGYDPPRQWIEVGNIHATKYKSESFDAVLLGWMLAYSTRPDEVIREVKRILKPGGLLGIAMEAIAADKLDSVKGTLENPLNSSPDLMEPVAEEVVYVYDPKPDDARYETPQGYNLAVIFRLQA